MRIRPILTTKIIAALTNIDKYRHFYHFSTALTPPDLAKSDRTHTRATEIGHISAARPASRHAKNRPLRNCLNLIVRFIERIL